MKAKYMNLHPYEKTDMFGRSVMPIKYGYAERPGDPFVIEPRFDRAEEFSDEIAPGYGPLAFVKENGKVGIIKPDGTYFIKPQFDHIRNFSEGFAAVCINRGYYVDWGFIKLDGSYLVAPMFDKVDNFHEGYAKVWSTSETRGFIQPDGSYILKSMSDIEDAIVEESDYDDVKIAGISMNGKVGYIDTAGVWYDKKPE